jgi:hypothetical protein
MQAQHQGKADVMRSVYIVIIRKCEKELPFRIPKRWWKDNIVAYLLKARIVEPEKQPLLADGSETTFVSRQGPRNKQRNNVHC